MTFALVAFMPCGWYCAGRLTFQHCRVTHLPHTPPHYPPPLLYPLLPVVVCLPVVVGIILFVYACRYPVA